MGPVHLINDNHPFRSTGFSGGVPDSGCDDSEAAGQEFRDSYNQHRTTAQI